MPATTPIPFLIYNASAGAGKTHTLVRSFLFRWLSSPNPNQAQRLLAITFTNKAAQEMKNRILEKLQLFASNDPSVYEDDMFLELVNSSGLSKTELQKRARNAYLYIIHHFNHLHVVTIDKLTHQIIRTFARDLGINSKFDVALDGKAFMAEVVDRILDKAGEDKILTQVLTSYVLQKADELKSWDVSKEILDIAEMFLNENHMRSLTALSEKPLEAFTELNQKLENQINTLKEPIKEKATELLNRISQTTLALSQFPRGALPNLLNLLKQGDWPSVFLNKTLQKSIETRTFLLKSAKKGDHEQFEPLVDVTITILNTYAAYWKKVQLLGLLRKNIVPLSLMQHIGLEVSELQEERNSRLLGFFNKHISDTIKDTSTPFIYERLGVRFQHFFVDEFQDTSVLQWSNLIPLFSHALEGEQRNGSLVLVGDAKQSIYRWRGGVPEQFIALANETSPFTVQQQVQNLPTNFRSATTIVRFNNSFFTAAATYFPLETQRLLYTESCDQEPYKKEGGYVALSTIEGKNKEEQDQAYQQAAVAKVEDCLRQGYRCQDICVLVRKNNQGVKIAEALTEKEIPITSSESLLISQSPEVQFLMNLVHLRHNPSSRTIQHAVLEPFAILEENPFHWTQEQLERPIEIVFRELTSKKFDFTTFQKLPLYAALEYAIWAFSFTEELTAHLQGFLDEVLKLQHKKEATTTQLIAYWERNKDKWAVNPPEGRDAVRIMTVHKAKGLAFPVVILPFSDSSWMNRNTHYDWFPLPKNDYSPFEEMLLPISQKLTELGEGARHAFETYHAQSLMDTVNTLYVGMTRPIEELHVITTKGANIENPNTLADLFALVHPELKERQLSFGDRIRRTPTSAKPIPVIKTPWTFTMSHVLNTMATPRKRTDEIQFGLFFHEVMSHIEVPQDMEYALSQSIAQNMLNKDDFSRLKEHVHAVVFHDELKEYFNPKNKIYCERPLLTANGEVVRPDRFVVTSKGEGLLLDYKTGSYKEEHVRQIMEYAHCLKQTGLNIKQKVLVYTEKKLQLKEVY